MKTVTVEIHSIEHHSFSEMTTVDALVTIYFNNKLYAQDGGEWYFEKDVPKGDAKYYEMLIKGAFQ